LRSQTKTRHMSLMRASYCSPPVKMSERVEIAKSITAPVLGHKGVILWELLTFYVFFGREGDLFLIVVDPKDDAACFSAVAGVAEFAVDAFCMNDEEF